MARTDRPWSNPMRIRSLPAAVLLVTLLVTSWAHGDEPAESLLRLVPKDAGVTFVVEDLRGHLREIRESPLAAALERLPAFRAWLRSENYQRFQEATARVENLLGQDMRTIAGQLFGDAVVLSLRLPEGQALESARGLLLTKVSDRALLDRLTEGLNAAMKASGELREVSQKQHHGARYSVREFRPGSRLTEYYLLLDGSVFVWSNSEELLLGAMDRQASGGGGLAETTGFRHVRSRLSARAAVSLFVDPRFVERLLASAPAAKKPQDELPIKLIGRYLAALNYAGAALTWRDGLVVQTEESFDPAKVDPALKRWANAQPSPVGQPLRRVPKASLAFLLGSVDMESLFLLIEGLTPPDRYPRLDNLLVALKGVLLDLDPRTQVFPNIGPGILVYLERPDQAQRMPVTMTLALADRPAGLEAGKAIDNGLRTLLALYALDEKRQDERLRVKTRTSGDVAVTTLGDATPFAYTVHDRQLVLATSTGGVVRATEKPTDVATPSRAEALRAAYFPGSETFLCVDVRAVTEFANPHRAELARRLAKRDNRSPAVAALELEQVLALLSLFDAAFLTTAIDPGFRAVHHTLGIVASPTSVAGKR